jgi:hypothetical protein
VKYTYELLAAGAIFGVGNTAVLGGALTAGEYGGAMAVGYLGAWLTGATSAEALVPWLAAGAGAGAGIVTAAGVAGAAAAGYAIGSVGYCTFSCYRDPCFKYPEFP